MKIDHAAMVRVHMDAVHRLLATWKQREAEMMATIPDEQSAKQLRKAGYIGAIPPLTKTVASPRSAAIARCRRELAEAFGLPDEPDPRGHQPNPAL